MFDQLFVPIIIERLKAESPKAKENNGYLRKIRCRNCKQEEAYTSLKNPWVITCPRINTCNVEYTAKELFPDLWENFADNVKNSKNPKAIASAYLTSRGIDPSNIDFIQDSHIIDKVSFCTVSLHVEGMRQQYPYRVLIDGPSDNKRWKGGESHSGLVYLPDPKKSFDTTQPIYITEAPLDCLSLRQAGLQAVSVFSAYEIPTEFFNTLNKNQPIRLAFDNDRSGCQGILKNLRYLRDAGFTDVAAFLPPAKQKDWNAVLQYHGGKWNISDSEKANFLNLGKQLTAESALQCFKAICEGRAEQHYTQVFEHRDRIFKGAQKSSGDQTVVELSDKSLRFKFRELDEHGRHSYHLQVGHNHGRQRAKVIELKAEDMLNNRLAELVISMAEGIVTQNRTDLQLLYKFLLNSGNVETIRTTGLFGHDPKSDWFLFGNVAFDPSGKMHLPIKGEDYFKTAKGTYLRPFNDVYASEEHKIVGIGKELSLSKFIEDIDAAYGAKGLLVMGFFIAGMFRTHIFNHYRVFPFLSVVGPANLGKSTLMHLMSRAFAFVDREGVPLNETNTRKGIMRTIAPHSSTVLCLTEWTEPKDFNESALKNMYGGGSIQTRAAFTNDNKTINTPLRCALAFAWNDELLYQKPVQQRFVTVRFSEESNPLIRLETKNASNALFFGISAQDTCSIGAQVLQERLDYQNRFIGEIENQVKVLGNYGIDDQRIARNHAFPLAGIRLFLQKSGMPTQQQQQLMDRVLGLAITSAESKMTKASNRLPNADMCLQVVYEAIDGSGADWIRVERVIGCRKGSEGPELYFHLPSFLSEHQTKINKPVLNYELNRHDDFITRAKVRLPMSNKPLEVWVFKFKEGLEVDDTSYSPDGVTHQSNSNSGESSLVYPEIVIAKKVLVELWQNQPTITVDLLGQECMDNHPNLFPDVGKWRLFTGGQPFKQAFNVDEYGAITIK